jgi:hypothetical protein
VLQRTIATTVIVHGRNRSKPSRAAWYRRHDMGAWGSGSFENDNALDFVGDVVDGEWQAVMELALVPVESGAPIPDEESVIAAAEIVAAARGHAAPELPDDLAAWLARAQPRFSDELAQRCQLLVRSIAAKSELRDLWEEADGFGEWLTGLEDLEARLGRAAPSPAPT